MLEATERPSEGARPGLAPPPITQGGPPDPGGSFLDPSEIDALLDRTQAITQALDDEVNDTGPSAAAPILEGESAAAETESLASLDERLSLQAKASLEIPTAPSAAASVTPAPSGQGSVAAPISDASDSFEVDLSGFLKPAAARRDDRPTPAAPSPADPKAASGDKPADRPGREGAARSDRASGQSDVPTTTSKPSAVRPLVRSVDRIARRSLGLFAWPVRGLEASGRRRVNLVVLTLVAWAGLSWVAVLILAK